MLISLCYVIQAKHNNQCSLMDIALHCLSIHPGKLDKHMLALQPDYKDCICDVMLICLVDGPIIFEDYRWDAASQSEVSIGSCHVMPADHIIQVFFICVPHSFGTAITILSMHSSPCTFNKLLHSSIDAPLWHRKK